ncbi:MAG: ATP-binding cassette domain-containing protein, partial [Candidatus Latescibacteria bacterium]|nr:ATP-binding cassette domain-containing protein [Candidatus Latescibacterota bacterium]
MNETSGNNTVVEVHDVRVAYAEDLPPVLDGVSLRFDRGDVSCIVGGSGCGKSTLLKTIIGLVAPRSGDVTLLDAPIHDLAEVERDALLRRVGVMFQYGAMLGSLTVGENISLPLEMHTTVEAGLVRDVVETWLERVGLAGTADKLPSELSGGMRKRAALARAMVMEPEVLFCDEPGAGLDPITAAGIDRLLQSLNERQGTTIIVVTHELLSIERLDGRLVMLDGGRVVYDGTAREARDASRQDL